MFKSITQWHRDWEDEILQVLQDPARLNTVQPGYRRRMAEHLAKMSTIERQQVHAFTLKYRGLKGYLALGKLLLALSAMALALHFMFPAKFSLLEALVVTHALGLCSVVGFVSMWFNYRRIPAASVTSFLKVVALATLGALVGASLSAFVDGRSVAAMMEKIGRTLLIAGIGVGTFYSIIYGAVSTWRNREYEMLTTKLQMQAEQERLARQLSETRLRLLQAQIEPHFLFNTLGAVQQLAQTESPRAAELTANLITFLRASLGDMRTEHVTLQAELALIEAYLKVMKTRLGNRLQFSLSLPPALADVRIPGMLVLTLVENAIKHGIEPALRGGTIDVVVTEQGAQYQIDVRDTGAGESLPTTLGVGLSNLKERVQLAYGTAGSFTLQTQEPSGMLATLRLPLVSTHEVTP
ncbi:MAG: hypothetical protein CFE39_03720 [Comamonadaceae bacterium PBBC2]|nr:MAG: hypothetical protein CFE39_03720 [Comamonadaceae bacterium PBBC2]